MNTPWNFLSFDFVLKKKALKLLIIFLIKYSKIPTYQVKNITDESIVHLETEISRHYEGKTKDLLEEALLALKEKVKRNMLCYIKFIDELYHHSIIDGSILQWCFDRIEELNELEKNSWKTSEKVNYSTEAQQDENTLQERSQEKSKQLTLNLKQENEYLKEMVDVLQTTILDGGGIKDKRVEELEKVNQELQKQNHDLDQKIESIITEYRTNLVII
uniref:Uncharacterized protein n=1 Tax=Acrobeloides nanus TaxID=290746 RepID=A0A914E6Y5_9BILA